MKLNLFLGVISAITLISCTTYTVTPLPMPSEAVVRPSEASLDCLDDHTYEIIVKSYKRIKTLESIIESTHE